MTRLNDAAARSDDELLIERKFRAPASLLFRVWEDPGHMRQWLGPDDFVCTALTLDFRPGGKWRGCITSKEHGDNWMGGEYRAIERDRRIVFTFAWEDGPGEPGQETLVTVTFTEADGGTIQTFHQRPFASLESRDSHIEGWNECFERQRRYVEALARAGAQ